MIAPIDQLAEALGVRNCYSGREWLLRLLVPPPERRPQLPDAVQRRLRPFADACAGALGVDDRRRWRDWLTAMCVRTLRARRRQRSPVRVPVAILRFALAVIAWPLQRFEALLDGIDFAPVTAQLERWSVGSLLSRPFSGAVAMIFGFGLVVLWATTPLSFAQQSAVFLVMWVLTLVVRRIPGHVPTLIMMGFSVLATARYVWWRVTQTLVLESGADYAFGLGLVVAESYAWLILVLGFIQNAWPLDRPTVALPEDSTTWPVVDVYIPSYNEPLKVVKPTVLAALSLDWPRDKLRVHLLDDGRRDSFRSFAREVGANYIQRNDNAHAKAGNLNHAMKVTDAEFIAIFDCDHIPVRSFLQTTVGWFLKDRKCALVQTPHHFFSPDPFERNLDTFGRVPNEGSLFYGLVQDGNDLWNASFFCGSCAVLRRTALAQVGGIAVETVTEDAHTALKMHRLGWTSAYLKLTQAAGLATESLSAHVGQRIRWARGMAQIFRLDNPMFGPGLRFFQRICYANAMLHFFYGLPRLVFLTSPLAYLLFEMHVINAQAIVLAIYVLPHLVQASLANSRTQGRFRYSFWAEAYESVLAWYIAVPTAVALIKPSAGTFNVTAKGGLVERPYFDWAIAVPYLTLVALNTFGLALAVPRLLYWNSFESGTVIMNAVWALANVVMMGTALGVAAEARQVRVAQRVALRMPACLYLPNGHVVACETEDYSANGLGLALPQAVRIAVGTRLHVGLRRGGAEYAFEAVVTAAKPLHIGLRFEALSLDDERRLIECTFGRADAWLDNDSERIHDRPLHSLIEVLGFGLRGYYRALRGLYNALTVRHIAERPA